jgi:hypothetical protein
VSTVPIHRPPLTSVLLSLSAPARCHRSPLLCCAALLYVQVAGERAVGEEKLQEDDSVQSVMQRAVDEELIDPIRWREVAGWELWGSRAKAGHPIQSGTSSERLRKLLPFPDESLLVLTRQPLPPTTSSSSSSSSASASLPSSDGQPVHYLSVQPIITAESRCLTMGAASVCCSRCVVQC